MKLTNRMSALVMCIAAGSAYAQETPVTAFSPYTAEIAAKTLHVRSGPSTNYYPVARLNAGTRVQVVGQESGWLAITPPPGSFSLIAAKFLDRTDGAVGVVNADNVRVRAGSDLSTHNYAIQLKLSRGAKVNILGPMDAEFLKIEPPAGSKVWLAAEYVRRVADGAAASDPGMMPPPAETPATGTETAAASPTPPAADPSATGAPPAAEAAPPATDESMTKETLATAPVSTPSVEFPSGDDDGASDANPAVPSVGVQPTATPVMNTTITSESSTSAIITPIAPRPTAQETPNPEVETRQKELETLDQGLTAEMAKPILNRDLAALLPRYQNLAGQGGDEYTQAYARIRVQQIEAALEMIDGVRTVGRLRDEIHSVRQTAMTERSTIRYLPVRTDGGYDIEGELRPSAVYESPIGPKRFRIVDPTKSPARTIGYLEIPADAPVDMAQFFGRRVGVKAHQRMMHAGDVDPLSVYVAAEVVALDSGSGGSTHGLTSVHLSPPAVNQNTSPGSTAWAP